MGLAHVIIHELYENSMCEEINFQDLEHLRNKKKDLKYFFLINDKEFDRSSLCINNVYRVSKFSFHLQTRNIQLLTIIVC